jgi:hypothetical protein
MIMQGTIYKLVYLSGNVVGAGGLYAVGDLPNGWQQLGVAGGALFVLLVSNAWVLPRVVNKIMDGHAKANAAIVSELSDLVRDLSELRGEKKVKQ